MTDLETKIEKQCRESLGKYKAILDGIDWVPRGILLSEGLAFCAIADLMKVDTIIESGIYNGRSTQIWAEYFPEMSIIAIDEQLRWKAIERLKQYRNTALIKGNSQDILLRNIAFHKDKKIAVFIDGPKGKRAVRLAERCLKFPQIKVVGIHDLPRSESARTIVEQWERPVFFTDEEWYIDTYRWLDENDSQWCKESKRKWIPGGVIFNNGTPAHKLLSYGPTIGFVFNG